MLAPGAGFHNGETDRDVDYCRFGKENLRTQNEESFRHLGACKKENWEAIHTIFQVQLSTSGSLESRCFQMRCRIWWLSSKTIIYVDVSYRVPGFLSCFIHSHISAKLAFQKHGDDDSQEGPDRTNKRSRCHGTSVFHPELMRTGWKHASSNKWNVFLPYDFHSIFHGQQKHQLTLQSVSFVR